MRRYASTNPFVEAERRKPEDTMREGDEMSGAELSTRRPISFFFYYGIYTIVYEDGWIMHKR